MLKPLFSKRKTPTKPAGVSDQYLRARTILSSGDEAAMRDLVSDANAPPEALYHLAEEGTSAVRQRVAKNP